MTSDKEGISSQQLLISFQSSCALLGPPGLEAYTVAAVFSFLNMCLPLVCASISADITLPITWSRANRRPQISDVVTWMSALSSVVLYRGPHCPSSPQLSRQIPLQYSGQFSSARNGSAGEKEISASGELTSQGCRRKRCPTSLKARWQRGHPFLEWEPLTPLAGMI